MTPGPWAQGRVLSTERTRRWDADAIAEQERAERMCVFAGFTPADEGRSRCLIAACALADDAATIALLPELVAMLRKIVDADREAMAALAAMNIDLSGGGAHLLAEEAGALLARLDGGTT